MPASLIDNSKAGIVLRRAPAVPASVDPAVDNGVALAGLVTDAGAAPESHDDLAVTPRVPLRARRRIGIPDRNIVRQTTSIYQYIRTHVPDRQQDRPVRSTLVYGGTADCAAIRRRQRSADRGRAREPQQGCIT